MKLARVAFVLLAACGHDLPGAPDASSMDSSVVVDDAPLDDARLDEVVDAAQLDPTTCTVGATDGCCPVAVAYGGSDPDCASLNCTFALSTPIPLDDDWRDVELGGVGMAWTGSELVLAWNSSRPSPTSPLHPISTITYERRDPTGALTFGPVTNDDRKIGANTTRTAPELGFEPTSGTILFASSAPDFRYAETLDANGVPSSAARSLGVDCDPITSRLQIYPWQGQFLVAQGEDPCGPVVHRARVDRLSVTGTFLGAAIGEQSVHSVGMTWDPTNNRIVFSGGSPLSERVFVPPSMFHAPTMLRESNTRATAISAGAGTYLVTFDHRYSTGDEIRSDPWAGTWNIDHLSSAPNTDAYMLPSAPDRKTVAARLVWTGSGWLQLQSSFVGLGGETPNSYAAFSTKAWRFASDGSVAESFDLDPTWPTYLVNAIWAGDRMAITYVSMQGGLERRFLRYASCAP